MELIEKAKYVAMVTSKPHPLYLTRIRSSQALSTPRARIKT